MTEELKKKVKESDSIHKTDDKGNVLVYDRLRDNLTSTGRWISPDGKEKKFNGW